MLLPKGNIRCLHLDGEWGGQTDPSVAAASHESSTPSLRQGQGVGFPSPSPLWPRKEESRRRPLAQQSTRAGGRTEMPCVHHKCAWTDSKQNHSSIQYMWAHVCTHAHELLFTQKQWGPSPAVDKVPMELGRALTRSRAGRKGHQGGFLEAVWHPSQVVQNGSAMGRRSRWRGR